MAQSAKFDFDGQVDSHDRGGGNYADTNGDGKISHSEAQGGDHNPVGDDEYETGVDEEKEKQDLGALEAAKMAIKFLEYAPLARSDLAVVLSCPAHSSRGRI